MRSWGLFHAMVAGEGRSLTGQFGITGAGGGACDADGLCDGFCDLTD